MHIAYILHRYAIIALFKPVLYNGEWDEVCGECVMYCGDEKCVYCWWGQLKD